MWWLGGRNASCRKDGGGFSLIEILLVLAGLAILAAILLPVLSRVRQAGYQAKCASNLMQLGAAFNTYSQDWDDYWPCPGGLVGDRSYWHQSGRGGLLGYVKQRGNKSIFCCPLMPDWKSYYDPRSYCMNSYLREPADVEYYTCTSILKGIRTPNIQQMSRTILLFEGLPLTVEWEKLGYYVYIYRCCNWTGVKGYYPKLAYTIDPANPWHGRFNNYLYTDGHLRARPPGTKPRNIYCSHKEMYEWYVDKVKFEQRWARGDYPYAPYE